jgi:threonylcarbamoyladenosine tRNA methylthiotransferase MtaB
MKTIKFYTLGCKVNQYETQMMREQFLRSGYKEIDNGAPAENYLINTCTVTQRADSESLGLIRRAQRENPKAKIIVTGCLTELDADRIRKACQRSLIIQKGSGAFSLYKKGPGPFFMGITRFQDHTRAFLKIQDGCNNFCSYCKVPLVRGKSRSKPLKDIIEEAECLVKNGFKEIVLTGICLGSYGKDLNPKQTLVAVIEELEKIEGLLRIRLSSIEAGDVSDELIERMAESKELCPHLHIPLQSGDDEILKKMHRSYTRDDYLKLIRKIKKKIPRIAITTDVLVGFPSENEENFGNTLKLIQKIQPLKVHIFPYSRREKTAAANLGQEVPSYIIKERTQCLRRIAQACAKKYQKQFLNKRLDILIEGPCKENPGYYEGYADNYLKIFVSNKSNFKNQLISLELKEISKIGIVAA